MTTGQGDLGGSHVSDGAADPAAGQFEDLHTGKNVPRKGRGSQPTVPSVTEPMLGGAAGDHVLQSMGAQIRPENENVLTETRDSGRGDGNWDIVSGDPEGRALSLGVDSLGGYAVPYQLDGTKKRREPKPHLFVTYKPSL